MRVLIIGGTQFIDPPAARRLHELGCTVTVFHRGETEADLPPAIEHLHGDRQRLSAYTDVIPPFRAPAGLRDIEEGAPLGLPQRHRVSKAAGGQKAAPTLGPS